MLAETILAQLSAAADPARAPKMQAYMKSSMPYLGVAATPARKITRAIFKELKYHSSQDWQRDVRHVFQTAQYREQWYAAVELCDMPVARPFQRIDALPLYREMIEKAAWWDVVDAIAGHRLCDILAHDRDEMTAMMLRWAHDSNIWVRRSAILCQLHAKKATDFDLMQACIEPSLPSKEFFLRKAIGWSLRQYGWTAPDVVRDYVAANAHRMSPLSVREAMKNLNP